MGIFALYKKISNVGKKNALREQAILCFAIGFIPFYALLAAPSYDGDAEHLSDHWVTVVSAPYAYKDAYAMGFLLNLDGQEEGNDEANLYLPKKFLESRSCLYDTHRACVTPVDGWSGELAKGSRFIARLDSSKDKPGMVVGAFDENGRAIFSEAELLAWLVGYRVKFWLMLVFIWGWGLTAFLILLYRNKYGWKEDAKAQKRV